MTRSVPFDPRKDISLVVLSCDRYSDLWEPFFGCLERYWPDCPFKVHLVTNIAPYQRPGVSVINIGPDRDHASNLIEVVNAVTTPWLILWVEDYFFTERIDTARVLSILEEAVGKGADYLKLTEDAPLSYDETDGARVGEIPRGVRYRSAIGTALYRKETLRKLLIPGMSIWQLDKSRKSDELPDVFMALTLGASRKPPLPIINAVVKGRWHWVAPAFLRREGYHSVLAGRQRQSFWSYLYIRAYWLRIAMYQMLRRHWYD
jgi:hypothetical protein